MLVQSCLPPSADLSPERLEWGEAPTLGSAIVSFSFPYPPATAAFKGLNSEQFTAASPLLRLDHPNHIHGVWAVCPWPLIPAHHTCSPTACLLAGALALRWTWIPIIARSLTIVMSTMGKETPLLPLRTRPKEE